MFALKSCFRCHSNDMSDIPVLPSRCLSWKVKFMFHNFVESQNKISHTHVCVHGTCETHQTNLVCFPPVILENSNLLKTLRFNLDDLKKPAVVRDYLQFKKIYIKNQQKCIVFFFFQNLLKVIKVKHKCGFTNIGNVLFKPIQVASLNSLSTCLTKYNNNNNNNKHVVRMYCDVSGKGPCWIWD